MPNFFMPAKDPAEVRDFFQPLVEQGKLMVLLANERPDVYDHVKPADEIRLIVDREDVKPPEGVEFDRVLQEFRPDPIPEDQVKEWMTEITASLTNPESSDGKPEGPEASPEAQVESVMPDDKPEPEVIETVVGDATVQEEHTIDKAWTPFSERGYKG